MKKLYFNYLDTFKGLSKEVWWLSLITLINRAGTMVIPFLSLYLNESLSFTKEDIGIVMIFFGLGSVGGSWLGGKLTDRIGYYKIMVISLLLTGLIFLGLQYITTFYGFCFGILVLMLIADAFRPAMFVALKAYSKEENRTRSLTLIRLAINLGFTAGPALGGVIITFLDYNGLFWVDGITCFMAGILLLNVLNPKKAKATKEETIENPVSAYSDKAFWIFFVAMFIFGFVFLQYFSTMPLYYAEVHTLSELEIGLLLGANGFTIVLLEMPLITWIENGKSSLSKLMVIGMLLTGLSFVVLYLTSWVGILIVGMLLMTIGEMIFFPFSNAFAVERSKKGKMGQYMGLYTIAFSLSHIVSHYTGLKLVVAFGYDVTWVITSIISFIGILCLLFLMKFVKKETHVKEENIISENVSSSNRVQA